MSVSDIPEAKREVKMSWLLFGWVMFSLVAGTFTVTSFYHDIVRVEERLDKKTARIQTEHDKDMEAFKKEVELTYQKK